MDEYFVVHMAKEQELRLMDVPIQSLSQELTLRATVARSIKEAERKPKRMEMEEVDKEVCRMMKGRLTEQENKRLRGIKQMATW